MKLSKVLFILLSVAVGALFIYSAYTKAFPVYTFESTLVEYLGFPWVIAAIFARAFVGIEAAMGLLIALNIYGREKWVLKSAFWLLMAFNVYLIYIWIRFGNDVNCGCFGDAVWMNPSTSLIKNVLILAAISALLKFREGFTGKWFAVAIATISITLLIIPFIVFAIDIDTPSRIDLAPLYKVAAPNVPTVDLTKGKHVVAFLSPSCSHCRNAGLKLHQMRQKYPNLPVYMIIGGTTSDLTDFWKVAKAQDVPYIRMDKDLFMKYTRGVFPVILWVNNGKIDARVSYKEMSAIAIDNWSKK